MRVLHLEFLKFTAVLAGMALFVFGPSAFAAPAEITIKGQRGYPVALGRLSGAEGQSATAIVHRDMAGTGVFRFVSQPKDAFTVNGSASSKRIEGRVTDPSGKVLFNRAYQGSDLERLAHQFADDAIQAITGQKGITGSRIAFVSDKTGKKEIYLCGYDGSNVRQVTRDGSISVSPSLSPDGRKLAYTSYLGGFADVYLIDLPTGKRQRIISQPGTNTGAAFSPAGDKIALTMSFPGNPELFTAGLDGKKAKRLSRSKAVESSPTWSPDGKRVCYVSDATSKPQLYLVNSSGGRPQQLKLGYGYCVEPDWSPDGQRIAFNVRQGGRNHVAVHDFENKVTKTITKGPNSETPIWGADSRHLIYVQDHKLILHNYETGEKRPIVSSMGRVSEPAWTR